MDADFPPGMVEEIREFLKADGERLPGRNLYPEVFSTNLFFPLQRQEELAWMIRQAYALGPVTVMEIGADKGGGLYHWCKCLPSVRQVIACEIRGTPYAREFTDTFPGIRFLWGQESSRDSYWLHAVRGWLGLTKIDVLFIDGDKTRMVDDFDTYRRLLNPNGIVFVHDVQDREPKTAFNALRLRAGIEAVEYIDTRDADAALTLQAMGVPAKTPHESWLRHWAGSSCGVGMLKLSPEAVR